MTPPAFIFQALIVPHRSLSPAGVRMLIASICILSAVTAGIAIHRGAWPVGGFTGAELLLAAWLFRLHTRAARATELLMLTDAALTITRTTPEGVRSTITLPHAWLAVRLLERPGRVPALLLSTHGQEQEVAQALGETEKRDLAAALAGALHRMRNPVFSNPQLETPR